MQFKRLWKDELARELLKFYILRNNGELKYNRRLVEMVKSAWLESLKEQREELGLFCYVSVNRATKNVIRFLENLEGREM